MKLLVDSDEFVRFLSIDLSRAIKNIYIQTLSLEGDRAGELLGDLLMNSKADDIRILIDAFTLYVLNDRFYYLYHNFIDRDLRDEKRKTDALFQRFIEKGIRLKIINAMGSLFNRFPARAHKKLILVDDEIVYLGGINFSEHNFEWHDMMFRFENRELVADLKKDFSFAWKNDDRPFYKDYGPFSLLGLNGKSNRPRFKKVIKAILQAREEIFIESPYLSFPFMEAIKIVEKRGVKVTIITPEKNNYKDMKYYIRKETANTSAQVRYYPGSMSHLKGILIDNRLLIAGSSNFDYFSYNSHTEYVLFINDPLLVNEFIEKVKKKDLLCSYEENKKNEFFRELYSEFKVKFSGRLLTYMAKFNRK